MVLTNPWNVPHLVFLETTIVIDNVEIDVLVEARVLTGMPGYENHPELGGPEIEGYRVFEANTRIEITIPSVFRGDDEIRDLIEDLIWDQVESEGIL